MNNSVKISRKSTIKIQNENILWLCGYKDDRLYISFCWNITNKSDASNNYYYYQSHPDVKMEKVTILKKTSDCVMGNWIDMTELIFSDVKSIKVCNTSLLEIYSPLLTLSNLRLKLSLNDMTVTNPISLNICTMCHINHLDIITTVDSVLHNICCGCFNNTFGESFINNNLSITLKL